MGVILFIFILLIKEIKLRNLARITQEVNGNSGARMQAPDS